MNKYRQQFLLTKLKDISLEWDNIEIDEYTLYTHPELGITISKKEDKTIIMLGSIYDWEIPEHTNLQIVDILISQDTTADLFQKIENHAGHFIIIYKDKHDFLLFSDACGSREIYYDIDFKIFGSQTKLLCEFVQPEEHTDQDALDYYNSKIFRKRKLFIGDTTHHKNIKHLLPNRYIDIRNKTIQRYFPIKKLEPQKIDDVVPEVCKILKGFLKAAACRKKLLLATTAGYDSRLLFLASLDIDCKYFVYKQKSRASNHPDIRVPLLLTKLYNKSLEIIENLEGNDDVSDSVDFPNIIPKRSKYYDDHLYLNANISEITRNLYAIRKNINIKVLQSIKGYSGFKFAQKLYTEWFNEAVTHCKSNGYNPIDMFQWEESKGILYAKEMSIDYALGIDYFTPYNSHYLLSLMLSVPEKYRNYNYNFFYEKIMLSFSKDALKYPINPGFKSDFFRFLTRIGLFNHIKTIYLKYNIKTIITREV